MALMNIRPLIRTHQLDETIEFYTNILGFTCAAYNKEEGWAALVRDRTEIMAALPNEHYPFEKPVFTGSFYFLTDDVDQVWLEFNLKAAICYPIEDFDYGMREFAIFDNNGYLLQFGQEISGIE